MNLNRGVVAFAFIAGLGAAGAAAATQSIEARIVVPQSPEQAYAVLTDFPSFPRWNHFIIKAEGRLAVGETVTVVVHPKSAGPTTVHAKLLVVRPGEELRWIGKLGGGGLFDGEHYWRLRRTPEGGTEIAHGEIYHGLLVGLVGPAKFKADFDTMNHDMADELARRNPAPSGGSQ